MVHGCDRWISDGHLRYLKEPLYAFSMWGQLGVVLFFVISGYCITAAAYSALVTGKSIWRYSYERIRRIYPPYFVALVLTLLSGLSVQYMNSHHLTEVNHVPNFAFGLEYWFANIFLLQKELDTPMVNVVFWSLCYEVAFYVIIGIFLAFAQKVVKKRDFVTGVTVLVLTVGGSTTLTLGTLLIFGKAPVPFDLWHQFSIGGLLFFLLELKRETVSNFTSAFRTMVLLNVGVVCLLTIAYIALRQYGVVDMGHPSSKVRSTVCLLFAILLVGMRRFDELIVKNRLVRPLVWVGAFSYSLYLVHPIVLPYVDIVCRKAGLNGDRYWIAFWIQVAVAIAFGRLFYLLLEKRFISNRQVQRLTAEHVA